MDLTQPGQRAGRVCVAVLLAAAVLAGCGDSDSDTADESSASTPAPPAPTVTEAPTPTGSASTATAQPVPARTSRPTPSATTPAKSAPRVPLGADFRLQEGKSARVEGTDLVVTFTRLVSDSRCPTNVTCIQAGEATIALKVSGLDDPQSFELSTPGNAGANEKRLGQFVIQLQAVEPYPTEPAGSGQSDVPMVAVLRVVKQG